MTESKGGRNKNKEQMDNMKELHRNNSLDGNGSSLSIRKPTSLASLIVWNISKALENDPSLDIKDAIASVQCRLEQVSGADEIQAILSEHPYERHLACALLAWQQLGHNDAASLCRFVDSKKNEECSMSKSSNKTVSCVIESKPTESSGQNFTGTKLSSKIISPQEIESGSQASRESKFAKAVGSSSHNSYSMGPVVKLPIETKIVMRVENNSCCPRSTPKQIKTPEKSIMNKIDQACCLSTGCAERLLQMDKAAAELRSRAVMLARREAERVELLERAETAWRDLEMGYQRRLTLAEEKEEDITKQIQKSINERNAYKNTCTLLTNQLKEKSELAEKDRAVLNQLEKNVYLRACERLKTSEMLAKEDSLVAEQSCRAAQLDRDLQFKEEQARRKMLNFESEVDSARALTHETERAMRAELSALRDQIEEVSGDLLQEDSQNEQIKIDLEELRKEKMEIIEDLEGCKETCDSRMQGKVDELKKKRDELNDLKDKVMECRCKVPVDVSVEAKRTPSLVALCRCTPEDKILESCSCTSMRTKLLSDLFADLFSGLQAELGGSVTQMPCQLLKCLEDKHNWDRTSVVKTNLKNYFSKLLVGELDIAIATSIEKYHAKWVGTSCADAIKVTPGPGEVQNEGWQERAIERRAQKLATQLAEQLFQERADELTKRAQSILSSGPPPCECKPQSAATATENSTAVFPCLLNNRPAANIGPGSATPVYWHKAIQDVTQLRLQIEDLKKDFLKKEDLKTMEDKFTKIIQRPSAGCPSERSNEVERRVGKKPHGRISTYGGNGKMNDGRGTNAANAAPALTTPIYWHQAVQDVTQLRVQIEDLKKDSLKKEDLKMMEDKFAKIIQRASAGAALTNAKSDFLVNIANEAIKKEQKINRAVNQSGVHIADINKPTTYKRKNFETNQIKRVKKPNPTSKNGIDKSFKPFKKNEHTYAVNMCLCSSTKQQEQHTLIDKSKVETTVWKQKVSKDTVSQMSSSMRRSKPINTSLLSKDISAHTNSKESEEQICSSNCVCFHKMPSNTSIDKLLETLAKWKCDLDTSGDDKNIRNSCDFSKNISGCNLDDKKSLIEENVSSKTSVKSGGNSREIPIIEQNDFLNDKGSKHKIGLEPSNASKISKRNGKISAKSTGPIGTTESEYMGAINLDKSNEEICKCVNDTKKNKTTPYKCIKSSKCNCEKNIEAKKLEGNMSHTKKEKSPEGSATRTRQERRIKEITVIENMSKIKERNKLQSREKETNNKCNDVKTNENIFIPCEYQIKFLGVTLADANFPTKTQVSLENNIDQYATKTEVTKINVSCDECHPEKKITSKGLNQHETYQVKNEGADYKEISVTEFSILPNSIKKSSSNILMNKENSNCQLKTSLTNIDTKIKGLRKTHNENEHYENEVEDKLNKLTMFPSNVEGFGDTHIQLNNKYKHSEFGFTKLPRINNQETTNARCKNDQLKNCSENTSYKIKSNESKISKNTLITTSGNRGSFKNRINKIHYDQEENMIDDKNLAYQNPSGLTKEYKNQESGKQTLSCECDDKFDEFRKFINLNFIKQMVKQDVALDAQSLKDFKNTDQSCVCCNILNTDESKDLEENAFHLLEDYLKKKFDEFKASSCSSCILPGEEEQFFTIVLQRVKKLITDSTNQVLCKCQAGEEKTQGSWNRAYGLLQEYLKMKIKKVHCSCLLTDDNNDTILPDVLKKVCNLIEYDFQRLKDVCGCKNDLNSQGNPKKSLKQVNFESEIPEKDINVLTFKDTISVCHQTLSCDQIHCSTNQGLTTHVNQSSISSQIPLKLEMDIKSSSPLEIFNNLHLQARTHSSDKYKTCNYDQNNANVELLETKFSKPDMNKNDKYYTENKHSTPYSSKVSNEKNNIRVAFKTSQMVSQIMQSIGSIINDEQVKNSQIDENKPMKIKTEDQCESEQKSDADLTLNDKKLVNNPSDLLKNYHMCNSKAQQINNNQYIIVSKNDQYTQDSENRLINKQSENCVKYVSLPYIGYTINCSCDDSLGDCVCPKTIAKADSEKISNILKKSIPDETYFKKVSYIMNSRPIENINHHTDLLEMPEDIYLLSTHNKNIIKRSSVHECETAISSNKDEPFVLIKSTENVNKNHATTNTFEDNMSIDTDDLTNDETLDWCECTSSPYNPNKEANSEQLKTSIYFPAPLADNDINLKDKSISSENTISLLKRLPKQGCKCEMIPICHVKLLVENIETKLANSKCTCDSLIQKVCPVHSTKC